MEYVEIERKFLVTSEAYKNSATALIKIKQGFLNTHPERTVRVRLKGDNGYLTVKGLGSESGTSRFEWETEISSREANKLLALCEPGILEKTRYLVPVGNHMFEVDEFYGENAGLVVAEIEVQQEEETFEKPLWLGEEVTGKPQYYNSQLAKTPFSLWKD